MRKMVIYIILDYIILIFLIIAVNILLSLITHGELEFRLSVIIISVFIIPHWLTISCFNKNILFGRCLGFNPFSVNLIKNNMVKKKEYHILSFCSTWKIHITLLTILGIINTIAFAISMWQYNLNLLLVIGGVIIISGYFYSMIAIYYTNGYKIHNDLRKKFCKINYIIQGKEILKQYDSKNVQEIGKYYLSLKLDYKNGYRWFFLTWFSAKIPIPVELQQYIDSRDKALINLFRPDPNAEDPLEKALFPLWAYIYWTLIGNDDAAREKYYQEAAKIGFDDTQWQLFYPKQLSAAA